jgi:hypothetical protein
MGLLVCIFYCYVSAFLFFSLSLGFLFQAFMYVLIEYFRYQTEERHHFSAADSLITAEWCLLGCYAVWLL